MMCFSKKIFLLEISVLGEFANDGDMCEINYLIVFYI